MMSTEGGPTLNKPHNPNPNTQRFPFDPFLNSVWLDSSSLCTDERQGASSSTLSSPRPHASLCRGGFCHKDVPKNTSFGGKGRRKTGDRNNKSMTVLLLLLQRIITIKQVAILNTIEGSIGPSQDTQALQGWEDRGLQTWWLGQNMLSIAQHQLRKQTACSETIEGSSGRFPSFHNPPRPPTSEFPPYPRGEGQYVRQLWGRLDH